MKRIFNFLVLTIILSQYIGAQTASELKSKLPDIKGWNINADVEVFNPDNLFERINGAAEGYLLYDFKELIVFVYDKNNVKSDDSQSAEYITIQVYRHATPVDAFGIYAAERPVETNFLNIGAEGYQEGTMLNFFVDCLYVKMESPSSSPDVPELVKQIAVALGSINTKAGFPLILQAFPSTGRINHTEQYVPKSFLGHEFLNHAFTCDYQSGGKKYQVFIIDAGSVDSAKDMLTKYYQFTKQSSRIREGKLTVQDKYNGDLECQWKGRYIWGVMNENGASVKIPDILKEIEKNLIK